MRCIVKQFPIQRRAKTAVVTLLSLAGIATPAVFALPYPYAVHAAVGSMVASVLVLVWFVGGAK